VIFHMQGVDVVEHEMGEVLMVAQIPRRNRIRALPQHQGTTAPAEKDPSVRLHPDLEPDVIDPLSRRRLNVRDDKHMVLFDNLGTCHHVLRGSGSLAFIKCRRFRATGGPIQKLYRMDDRHVCAA